MHTIVVSALGNLPCSIDELSDAVFVKVEGFGNVADAVVGRNGWKLFVEFDSPGSFVGIIDAVRQALTDLNLDLYSIQVLARGRKFRLVDLL